MQGILGEKTLQFIHKDMKTNEYSTCVWVTLIKLHNCYPR